MKSTQHGALGLWLIAGSALLGGCTQVVQETVYVEKPCEIDKIGNRAAGYAVRLWPSTGSHDIYVGQYLQWMMQAQSDAYLSLYQVSSSCKAYELMKNQRVSQGETVTFPGGGSGMALKVKPPAGKETYIMVATRAPFDWMAGTDSVSWQGSVGLLDMSGDQLERRLSEALSRLDPATWNVATQKIRIRQNQP